MMTSMIKKHLQTRAVSAVTTFMVALGVGIASPLSLAAVPEVNIQEQREIRAVTPTHTTSTSYSALNQQQADADALTQKMLIKEDRLAALIEQVKKNYQSEDLTIEEHTHIHSVGAEDYDNTNGVIVNNMSFDQWLGMSPYRANEVAQYQRYLASQVGVYNVPPMNQLLTTARSWQECGYEPYQLPPRNIWSNMIKTLKLYSVLKAQGILPETTIIRSVYRSPELNACAGGAPASKHLTNGAMDIWVPEYNGEPWYINPMQDRLCNFWATQGVAYDFGLGIYATGSIHLDTQGHRMWGMQHTTDTSPCRYVKSYFD